MVKRLFVILTIAITCNSYAQNELYIRPGLLAASITYAPSSMLNHNQSNFYANGFAEYFLDKRFSFRGDTYIFLNSQNEDALINDGIRSYFGLSYHVNKGNWDGNVGFQTGITYMNTQVTTTRAQIQPSAALRIGTTYYVWKYFHFFANLTYTKSKLLIYQRGNLKTDELIFSAGLGFQIQTRKIGSH